MKAKIAIVGSGNIGWALKQLLKNDYEIKQGDIEDGFDANDIVQVKDFLKMLMLLYLQDRLQLIKILRLSLQTQE